MIPTLHILSLVITAAAVALMTYGHLRSYLRARLRNQVLRTLPPWKRDEHTVRIWHQEMIMKLYDVKPEDRPIIISIVKTEKGEGAVACSHPRGWGAGTERYNYAQGTGLEILKTIASSIALMELNGNKHCLNTLLILLEEQRDRLNTTQTNTLIP